MFFRGLTESRLLNFNQTLSFGQNRPFILYEKGAVDSMLRGLTAQRSQLFDNLFTGEVDEKMQLCGCFFQ